MISHWTDQHGRRVRRIWYRNMVRNRLTGIETKCPACPQYQLRRNSILLLKSAILIGTNDDANITIVSTLLNFSLEDKIVVFCEIPVLVGE